MSPKILIMKKVSITLILSFLIMGCAGGGGSTQNAPDSVKPGEPALVKLDLSVWGSGGLIKDRYTDVAFYYRLVGEPNYKILKSNPIPVIFTGDQEKFNGMYESYTFTIPPYSKGTTGDIEYYFEMKLDGHLNRIDGIKKIKVNEGEKIRFEEFTAIINPNDKKCNLDNECVLFQPDCEDCKFDTINKEMLLKYNEAKTDYCSINKPKTMCDSVFIGKLRCINNKCTIE